MLDGELVNRLCKFGLTGKQAKIYLSVVISGTSSVADISKKTEIHKQDIYKILPKFEKMGLLTRTIAKPVKVESIPIKKALGTLIKKQQEIVESQEKNAEEIVEAVKKRQTLSPQAEEGRFTILPIDSNALKNRVDLVLENARKAYDAFIREKLAVAAIPGRVDYAFRKFAIHGVKVRMLIGTNNKDYNLIDAISKTKWPAVNVTIKAVNETAHLNYAIIDDKEVWIPLEFPLEYLGWPTELVTDSKSVVKICKENFERTWKDPETRTLFQQERNKNLPKRKRPK
jgi:sugar-specific transcriptional regulator TrmB